MNTQLQPKKQLKDSLFERIENERVSPHSKLFFQGRECAVWFLWLLSVFIGALAVAVSVFMVTHLQYELYEATHENFLTFMVEVLPYLWIIIFGLMVYVAIYNLQHTKKGYKYPVSLIIMSSVLLSFFGGTALQFFGFGYTIDNILGNQVSIYTSRDKLEEKLWQVPGDGRLLGKQVLNTVSPTSTIVFEDIVGDRWTMDVSELNPRDIELLTSKSTVRLLGKAENSELRLFHACGAFPLMIEEEVTMADMLAERELFIKRVYAHAQQAKERMKLQGGGTFASTSISKQSVCANIAAVKRIPNCENCSL